MLTRILTISDLPLMQAMIENVCIQSECEISYETSSGRKGIEACRRFKPDLVFIDANVLEQDDLHLLQALRIAVPHANVIVCASWGQKPLLIEAALHGAKEFLFNPIHSHQVKKAIQRYA